MREHRNDINMHEKFYDFLSEQYTFDHPLCQECTDTLLDKLDVDLQMATHELTSYQKLLEQLNSSPNVPEEDYEKLKQELIQLDEEEKKLKNELTILEQDNERIQNESEQLTKEEQLLEAEETRFLRDYNEQKRLLFEAEDEQKSIDNQIKHARAQYDKLSKTNAFNAAFHIWHQEHFGTINGFRLGRLPSINVEWSEINAGLGQAALLLNSLAKRIDLQFTKFRIVPLGSHSYIEDFNERKNGKYVQLPLYTGRRHFSLDTQFDKAMIAFLDCVNQFKLAIESKNQRFCLPYKMNEKAKGTITDSNGYQFSVRLQVSSQEQWTKALKYMLTNLKWGLTWITSQLPDDMTTSNAIPSPSSPTTTSPR
jgi:beclin 1